MLTGILSSFGMQNTSTSFEQLTGLPEPAAFLMVFLVGACIGSFLNVVIYRVPEERSLLTSSACPHCSAKIPFYYNIPILGWLMLRGKCANCGEKIAWRYPAIELLTALVFCLVYWQVGLGVFLPVAIVFAAVMMALVFMDADHMILPNVITYPLFAAALIVRVVYPILFDYRFSDMNHAPISGLSGWSPWALSLFGAILGALIGGGSLWLVGAVWKALRGVDAMGLGDVKLLLGVGALLGWRLTLLTIFIGAFTGALGGIIVLSRQKDKDLKAQIPFGIFLGLGAVVAMLFGDEIIAWYLAKFM